jgi:hypothetical protein
VLEHLFNLGILIRTNSASEGTNTCYLLHAGQLQLCKEWKTFQRWKYSPFSTIIKMKCLQGGKWYIAGKPSWWDSPIISRYM